LQRIVEEHLRNNQPVMSHVFHQMLPVNEP
jgi:hypothetical protein